MQDAFDELEIQSNIVFITSFDEYAIRSFKYNAIDYILKPPTQESLNYAISKASHYAPQNITKKLRAVGNHFHSKFVNHFIVRTNGFMEKMVLTDDIAYFYSTGGRINLFSMENGSCPLRENLEILKTKLDPNVFFRANRQFIINKRMILGVEPYHTRQLKINLIEDIDCPESIIISKERSGDFRKWYNT